ncbi:MAG TPA: hypothetical protein VIL30_26395 [Ramlibacter sp.]|jgi:hypothetical protein
MTPDQFQQLRLERFIQAGKILAGDEPGWPARLARRLDMNRGYVASIVAGTRPVNDDTERKLAAAIDAWWAEMHRNTMPIMRIKMELEAYLDLDGGDDASI